MNVFKKMFSICRSFFLNLKLFGFKTALKLPLLIKYNTKVIGLSRGCIELSGTIKRGMISIGMTRGTLLGEAASPCVLKFEKNGHWKVSNYAWLSGYCVINVDGVLETNGFSANSGFKLSCADSIYIGNDVLVGWDVLIIDSDGHRILHNEVVSNNNKPVLIEDHVWLCAKSTIMKGAKISKGSVVGLGSITTRQFSTNNLLICDNTVKKENISWEH